MKKNFFKKVTTSATLLALLSYSIAIVCFICAGLLMMLGDEGKKKGMNWLPYVIGGLFVISLAAAAVGYMQGLGG